MYIFKFVNLFYLYDYYTNLMTIGITAFPNLRYLVMQKKEGRGIRRERRILVVTFLMLFPVLLCHTILQYYKIDLDNQ